MTVLVKSSSFLFSSSTCVDETKETFGDAESVIKSYLKILTNLLRWIK